MTERYFKLILSERQLALVELALEDLSPGDDESADENEATLAAVRCAEVVR